MKNRWTISIALAAGALSASGYIFSPGSGSDVRGSAAAGARADEPSILYYRDPSGAPFWSKSPKLDAQGRAYVPVYDDEKLALDKARSAPPASRRVLYYRNPMGLPDISPVPKKDSMGMDYIPIYEGEAGEGGRVVVPPGKLQRTGVRTEPAEYRVVFRPIRVPGTVQLDERRVSVVATRSESFIDKVENVTTGDRVRKGQPLLRLYSPDVNAAAAQLVANPGFDGSRRRLQNLNVPDDAIADIERTRKVPLSIEWSSPRDGVVLERNATEGMRAAAGDVLFRIADFSSLWVLADVPEHAIGQIHPGLQVTIRVRSLPGRDFSGKIALVYPQVKKDTRTTPVRIELANPDGLLRPDMYADVEISTGSQRPTLAVPDNAIIDSGTKRVVILDKGEGRFEPREIKTGIRGGGFVEVTDGLSKGEKVVTSANFLIDAESNLKAALQGMAASTPESEERPR